MAAEADFWEHVKTGTPPEIDGSSGTTAALTALHPDSDESTVDLFCLAAELDRYADIGQNIKALETDRNECANRIKAFMATPEPGHVTGTKFPGKHRLGAPSITSALQATIRIWIYPAITKNRPPGCFG